MSSGKPRIRRAFVSHAVPVEPLFIAVGQTLPKTMNFRNENSSLVAFLPPDVETRSVNECVRSDNLAAAAVLLCHKVYLALNVRFDQEQRAIFVPGVLPPMLLSAFQRGFED